MFKVGDCVRYTKADNAIYRIIEVNLPYNNVKMVRNRSKYVEDKKYLKHWQPKTDEWCWFYKDKFSKPVLSRFSYKVKSLYESSDDIKYITNIEFEGSFKHCEPFIGELPSFINDK